EVLLALLHDHVTGGAGALATARVLEVHLVSEEHVEDRPRLTVVAERRVGSGELDRLLGLTRLVEDTDLWHRPALPQGDRPSLPRPRLADTALARRRLDVFPADRREIVRSDARLDQGEGLGALGIGERIAKLTDRLGDV